jgi:hypothetical protein
MPLAPRRGPGDAAEQRGRGVAQQHLGRGAGPERKFVAYPDDVPQRLRALLLGDADADGVADDVEVDCLALAGGELAHQPLGLGRQFPALPGQMGPPPQARAGHVAGVRGPQQPGLLQRLDDPDDGRLGQAGRGDDVADGQERALLGEQRQDVQGALDAAYSLAVGRFLAGGFAAGRGWHRDSLPLVSRDGRPWCRGHRRFCRPAGVDIGS